MSNGPHNEGIQVTNDGATILKSIGVDNPAAKVLVGKRGSESGGNLVCNSVMNESVHVYNLYVYQLLVEESA